MRWLDFLFPPRVDEATLDTILPDAFVSLVAPRIIETTRPHTTALLPFQHPFVRAAIHEAKYHGTEHAFSLLASALTEYLRESEYVGPTRSHILVPVPIGTMRHKERGFNQVEEVLTRVDKQLNYTIDAALLTRTRETASQVSLPREEREKNMHEAFRATRPVDPARTYIVIDDVITTGATLQAAVDALRSAGATHIVPLALAH